MIHDTCIYSDHVDNVNFSYIFLLGSWNVYKDMRSVFLFITYKLVVAHVVNPEVFVYFIA